MIFQIHEAIKLVIGLVYYHYYHLSEKSKNA